MPKTPQWAAAICGVPSRVIKALAREWASKKTSIIHGNGGPMIRGPYAHEPGRGEVLLLAMQGVGKPGVQQVKMIEWGLAGDFPHPRPVVVPTTAAGFRGGHLELTESFIPKTLIPNAILNPPVSWYSICLLMAPRQNQFQQYSFPLEGNSDIHMIWTETPSWIPSWNGGNQFIEALRSPKIEFMLAQHPWIEDDCLYADIILPVTTTFENEDIAVDYYQGNYATIFLMHKCIEPIGESRSDYEIGCMIAEKLGLLEEYNGGKTEAEWIRIAFDHSGVTRWISWEEFQEKQYFVVPTDPDWRRFKPGLRWYWEQPEGKGLNTPSGKIEFYSQGLAEHFPDDDERQPMPRWIPSGESHQETQFCARAEQFPLLFMTNHPRWGSPGAS